MSKHSDGELKASIEEELKWDPKVNAAEIGVTVVDGAVSLLGGVGTYAEKWAAEDATKRVKGVRTVAFDLFVKLRDEHTRTDAELAAAVQHTLAWDLLVPRTVTASIVMGVVSLEGVVTWNYQRDAAERGIRNLYGIKSVNNYITLQPHITKEDVKEKILAALQRQATTDTNSIKVEVSGSKITLSGAATSWQSVEDATAAAWTMPGVTEVFDKVEIPIL